MGKRRAQYLAVFQLTIVDRLMAVAQLAEVTWLRPMAVLAHMRGTLQLDEISISCSRQLWVFDGSVTRGLGPLAAVAKVGCWILPFSIFAVCWMAVGLADVWKLCVCFFWCFWIWRNDFCMM